MTIVGVTATVSSGNGDRQEHIHAHMTHMGSVNVPYAYAATHHGDSQPTFVQGARLRLEGRGGRHVIVRVSDVCEGSACLALDISRDAFEDLGVSASQGVQRVHISCGRGGHKPMRKCLAGEG